jgi:hypothetical protein
MSIHSTALADCEKPRRGRRPKPPQPPPEPIGVSVGQITQLWPVSRALVWRHISEAKLQTAKVGAKTIISFASAKRLYGG